MAAITSNGTGGGNWSSTGTWSGGIVPGDGDTVTITGGDNVTADTGTITVGSDNASSIPAIAVGSTYPASSTLTIANGCTLKVKGDLTNGAAGNVYGIVNVAAGGTLTMYPANSATTKINCQAYILRVTGSGTSGNHATIKVDTSRGSGNGCYLNVGSARPGLITATYTDFSGFGSSTEFGLQTSLFSPDGDYSVTNCTFTDCSRSITTDSGWDGNLTESGLIHSSSVLTTVGSINTSVVYSFGAAATSGVRQTSGSSFDALVLWNPYASHKVASDVFVNGYDIQSGTWPDNSYWNGNLVQFNSGDGATNLVAAGSIKDCFYVATDASNPHYVALPDANCTVQGCLFEQTGTVSTGDIIFPPTPTANRSISVTGCIVLPNAAGLCSGDLLSCLAGHSGSFKVALTVEHNTFCGDDVENGLVGLGETMESYAGQVASCRANISWSSAGGSNRNCAVNDFGTNGVGVDAVTVAGYNAFWNPGPGTSTLNGVSTSTPGYNGISVSDAGFPSAQLGTGDISADPQFVDSTREIGSWWIHKGHTTTGTFAGDAAAGVAYAATDPSTLIPDLLAWVRAGFQPQNSAFDGVSYSGDTYTTDANGNANPGSTLGAMAFLAGGGPFPFFLDSGSLAGGLQTQGL